MARIVFDLDGTLIDSVPDITAAANDLMAQEGLAPLSEEVIRGFVGNGADVLIAKVRAAHGIAEAEHPRLLADYVTRLETATALTRPYPGVVAALEALSAKGHALGICTNKPEKPARAVLATTGLAGAFETVIGGDTLPRRKPDPKPLFAAFTALGDGPMIFVGDSEIDAETADRAGVPFLLYTEGYRKTPVEDLGATASFGHYDRLAGLISDVLA